VLQENIVANIHQSLDLQAEVDNIQTPAGAAMSAEAAEAAAEEDTFPELSAEDLAAFDEGGKNESAAAEAAADQVKRGAEEDTPTEDFTGPEAVDRYIAATTCIKAKVK
ncbi:unnamed protein product, partial [Prorocentrum cordatum]